MSLTRETLLAKLEELGVTHQTIEHAVSPTCEVHTASLQGTPLEQFIAAGQAKNLFFKVPSGGGALKNRLFLACALVDTVVDNKALSTRLGIKASAPLRLAADDIFDNVLQIPKGSVNPFVMAQESCSEITLLLDNKFLNSDHLLFHPMRNDYTSAVTPEMLNKFLENVAPTKYVYVDFGSSEKIEIPTGAGAGAAAAKPKEEKMKPKEEKTKKAAPVANPKDEKPKKEAVVGSSSDGTDTWWSPPQPRRDDYAARRAINARYGI